MYIYILYINVTQRSSLELHISQFWCVMVDHEFLVVELFIHLFIFA